VIVGWAFAVAAQDQTCASCSSLCFWQPWRDCSRSIVLSTSWEPWSVAIQGA